MGRIIDSGVVALVLLSLLPFLQYSVLAAEELDYSSSRVGAMESHSLGALWEEDKPGGAPL